MPLLPDGLDLDTLAVTPADIKAQLVEMTEELGVWSTLGSPATSSLALVDEIERRMPNNPYHNFNHVFDVAQFMYTMLKRTGLARPTEGGTVLSNLELAALWTGCLCHDLDHPGHSSALERTIKGPIFEAAAADGTAESFTLEGHHQRAARRLLCEELELTKNMEPADAKRFEELVCTVIEATNLARHPQISQKFRDIVQADPGLSLPEDRAVFMQLLMKCSDLANTFRPMPSRRTWEDVCFEEFHREGDKLVELGLKEREDLPAMNDRRGQGKRQAASDSFFRNLVVPTFELLRDSLKAVPRLSPDFAFECMAFSRAQLACIAQGGAELPERKRSPRPRFRGTFFRLAVLTIPLLSLLHWSPLRPAVSSAARGPLGLIQPIMQWMPPLWVFICVGLLGFPLITLWEVYCNPPVKKESQPSEPSTPSPSGSVEEGTEAGDQVLESRQETGGSLQRFVAKCYAGALPAFKRNLPVLALCGTMVGLSVINKVLFRLVLSSVGGYVHALSTSTNLAYLGYSWTAVFAQVSLGSAAKKSHLKSMLKFAKRRWRLFASIGVCESIAFTLMPIGTPGIPKALVPVIAQAVLPMSMVLNTVLFKRKYTAVQFMAVVLIVIGIVTASAADPAATLDSVHTPMGDLIVPLLIVIASYFFLVLSLILKDVAFIQSANEGEKLDIFLVEGVAGIGQGVALFLQWPMNFALLTKLGPTEYLSAASQAFTSSAGLMPALILLYWAGNILYRLATLLALRQLSSLATLLANVLTVPLSALAFCLPLGLPLIGPPDRLSRLLVIGTLVVCFGLMMFNSGWGRKKS